MNFTYEGSLKADLVLSDSFNISIESEDHFSFSLLKVTNPETQNHIFRGEIEADTAENAIESATQKVILITKLLSIETDVGIYDINITRAFPDDDTLRAIGQINISGHARVVRTINNPAALSTSAYERIQLLLKASEDQKVRLDMLLDFLYRAVSSNEMIKKFWYLYMILDIILDDRAHIDAYIQMNYKDIPTLISDFATQNGWKHTNVSMIVAIRDTFSHQSTFSGQPLDLQRALRQVIEPMFNIAKTLLYDELEKV